MQAACRARDRGEATTGAAPALVRQPFRPGCLLVASPPGTPDALGNVFRSRGNFHRSKWNEGGSHEPKPAFQDEEVRSSAPRELKAVGSSLYQGRHPNLAPASSATRKQEIFASHILPNVAFLLPRA